MLREGELAVDREVVLAVLTVLVVGGTLPFGAVLGFAFARPARPVDSGRDLERAAARRVLIPLVPALISLAAVLGWALVEPANSERVPVLAFAIAVPMLVVCIRAAVRAVRALVPCPVNTAATVGLFAPRAVVCGDFASQLDDDALNAVLAHERAHVAHRDPLRVWLAQLVTDLQWPMPGARARLQEWRFALELARDEEARAQIDGADLAAAILVAVTVEPSAPVALVGVASPSDALRLRVQRLLEPLPPASVRPPGGLPALIVPGLVAAALF